MMALHESPVLHQLQTGNDGLESPVLHQLRTGNDGFESSLTLVTNW